MSNKNVLTIVSEFVEKAKSADNPAKAKICVDEGLAEMRAAGMNESSAVHTLKEAVVAYSLNHSQDHENLIHPFIELTKRFAP